MIGKCPRLRNAGTFVSAPFPTWRRFRPYTEARCAGSYPRRVIEDALSRRIQYETAGIDIADVAPDPYAQFERWLSEAASEIVEANAMVLATIGPDGPTSRAVLLREIVDSEFVFYTNRNSRKGRDIASDARVSLLFPWFSLHRQVRIDGVANPVSDEMNDAYFAARPRESQAGAAASPQSQPVPSRAWLDERVAEALTQDRIERPEHWGGYGVAPVRFEFWQGRQGRLHDRIQYERANGDWTLTRLAP